MLSFQRKQESFCFKIPDQVRNDTNGDSSLQSKAFRSE